MSLTLINNKLKRTPINSKGLRVSEFFCDTIQGEGINIGSPAAFLRVQGCILNCSWCDTKEIWKKGNTFSNEELFELMEKADLIRKFKQGQHLVLTGGSPLLQQKELVDFILAFIHKYHFKPYIEIENECELYPWSDIVHLVDCWNNSPKLSNSGNAMDNRNLILQMSKLENSWFKFVVRKESDWKEIEENYLNLSLIEKRQIILMPQGATLVELEMNRQFAVDLAIKNNVRYITREHVILWDSKTGV